MATDFVTAFNDFINAIVDWFQEIAALASEFAKEFASVFAPKGDATPEE